MVLTTDNRLAAQQNGFVPGRSTSDAINDLAMALYTARNRSHRSAVVFLDMRKAFDTVDHSILLRKLRALGLGPSFIDWIKNYLLDRQQQTRANDVTSSKATVNRGVPQGSVLGPLLFVAYVNDVCEVIPHGSSYLYADDLAVLVSGKNVDTICVSMQENLDSLAAWCNTNKLTVNTAKTKVLWAYSPRSIPDLTNTTLFMNNEQLNVVEEFNYLGAVLDTYMSLSPHLKKTINLVQVRLDQLRRIRASSDRNASSSVYVHMIRSIIDYCSFLSGGGPVWATKKLQTLQNNGLRVCERIKDPRGVDIQGLHDGLNVSTVETTRRRQLLTLLHKRATDAENVLTRPRVLRGNDNVTLKVPRVKKAIYERSPLYRGIPHWDELDATTQHLASPTLFLSALKGLPDIPID